MTESVHVPGIIWAGFFALVAVMMIFDLGLLHRKDREIGVRESLWLSAGYILVSLGFGVVVYHFVGVQAGKDFFAGYVIEKSLSLDNIFVISLVFNHFYIPRRYQHGVLFWGVLGAIILRGIMIALGVVLIQKFHAILYLFGVFLAVTGIKMLVLRKEGDGNLKDNALLLWLQKHLHVTPSLHENKFFVIAESSRHPGKMVRKATPLFLVLIFIELVDVTFAVDSVPAVFAITTDPFVVYTSNIFAVLGLRALYFALAAMLHRFTYLHYSLALILVFIGGKILLAPVIGDISSVISLLVTLGLLAGGIVTSLYKSR